MTLAPVVFDAPPVNPAPNGLYAVTSWVTDEIPRWLPEGVQVRPFNYGGAFGVWEPDWDAAEDDLSGDDAKAGERPDLLDPFVQATIWGADESPVEDITVEEAKQRAEQNLRLNAPIELEKLFAARMISDSPVNPTVADIVEAVGWLEMQFAATNTLGFIHASPTLAAQAAQAQLIVRTGAGLKTPLGHTWVFGGGYEDGLGLKVTGTSQPYGWRTNVEVRGDVDTGHHKFAAVAEQSFVIGYETMIGYADLDD